MGDTAPTRAFSYLRFSTPEQMRRLMEDQTKLWADSAAAIGLQPQ